MLTGNVDAVVWPWVWPPRALVNGIGSLMWKCALDLYFVLTRTSQVQLLSSIAFIQTVLQVYKLMSMQSVVICNPINDVWLCFESQDETDTSLMQAVNSQWTRPTYLDFEFIVSWEFDDYFRSQICATYEMCLASLRQAMEIFMAQFRADKDMSPNFS